MEGSHRRLTLYDQMLAVGDSREFSGLTLNDVLTIHKRTSPNLSPAVQLHSRTLLDIIRSDDFHVGKATGRRREKKPWKLLRDRLRLKISISEISVRSSGDRSNEMMDQDDSPDSPATLRPLLSRRNSTRFSQTAPSQSPADDSSDASRSIRPQISRHSSMRFSLERSESFADEPAREGTRRLSAALAEERALSAREAVAAQEAADTEAHSPVDDAAAAAAMAPGAATPARMSLMDLLEETDRQMGLEGSRYRIGDNGSDKIDSDSGSDSDFEDDAEGGGRGGGVEHNCCVCMVRHKGAAFIPCGHTFCRLCSRELWVSRGNCPLCNGFILEILDIF